VKFLSVILFLSFNLALYAQQDSVPNKKHLPYILFEKTFYNFGTLEYGSDATYYFEFINTGKTPLIINKCEPSCGCTVADWSKEPIKKNGKGTIKVRYNTTLAGAFAKTITVISNAQNSPVILTIQGKVKKKEETKP